MSQPATNTRQSTDVEVLRPPKRYTVCLLNDDFTPMQFVVDVLQEIFYLPHDTAEAIMWQVHREGKGCCGVYSLDIALSKCRQVEAVAQEAGHPLRCVIEESS